MSYSVKQLADLAGVSVRTLHYYHQIDLLAPSWIGDNGYRHYEDEAVYRLQQILLYRELGLSLDTIRRIIERPDFDRLAYKQEYWGDEFKFAGGNVSYYPYDPVAKEYVTRALITSNPMENGVSAGTFISQTGTSAGFVMQPMTAMTMYHWLSTGFFHESMALNFVNPYSRRARPLEMGFSDDVTAGLLKSSYTEIL